MDIRLDSSINEVEKNTIFEGKVVRGTRRNAEKIVIINHTKAVLAVVTGICNSSKYTNTVCNMG